MISVIMSLPQSFVNVVDYYEESMSFLQKYQYLYNFENTRVLTENVFEKMDITFIEHYDVFEDGFKLKCVQHNDEFLNVFLEKSKRLYADYGQFEADNDLQNVTDVPLGRKKKHEILYLSKEIGSLCKETNCSTVVDFGSGLGYLDQLIYDRSKYKVLGIECNEQNYIAAKKRQRKYHENSLEKVKYKRHTITESSDVAIREYLKEKFNEHGNICLTGLHACADLTVEAINIYLKIPEAKALVLMPCCYHKMNMNSSGERHEFKNFPLSDTLRIIYRKYNGFEFLRIPFLRLASQPPSFGESIKDLVFNLLARAVIQVYADKYNYKLTRKKRKAVKTKTLHHNFDSYIQNAKVNFALTCQNECFPMNTEESNKRKSCNCSIEFDLEELKGLWQERCHDLTVRKAAIFVLLQRHLQPIFENFVLYDRLVYLHEKGANNCKFKKIVDEKISPRCLALIVEK